MSVPRSTRTWIASRLTLAAIICANVTMPCWWLGVRAMIRSVASGCTCITRTRHRAAEIRPLAQRRGERARRGIRVDERELGAGDGGQHVELVGGDLRREDRVVRAAGHQPALGRDGE